MDWRERATSLSLLKKSGILTPNEARQKIGMTAHTDGDQLISEPLAVEMEKQNAENTDDKKTDWLFVGRL